MSEEEDFVIDDIITKKKKKINSSRKGKNQEREIVKIFNSRFKEILQKNPDWGGFSRSLGSGNRFGQKVNLSKEAKEIYSSDLSCPFSFLFSIESKFGYNEIDLCSLFESGNGKIDEFLEQVSRDALRISKKPLLIWKKNNQPRVAFIKAENWGNCSFNRSYYKDWLLVSLDNLLTLNDNFFFN